MREWWFWRSQNVPGPFRLPVLENALLFLRKPIFQVDYENSRRYGRLYVDYFLPGRSTLNILDPQLIRKVLVTDFSNFSQREKFHWPSYIREGMAFHYGIKWRRLRSLVTPIFTTSRMRKIYEQLQTPMQQTVRNLHRQLDQSPDQHVEMRQMMKCLALDMLCSICFSVSIDSYNEPNNELVQQLLKIFEMSRTKLLLVQLLPEIVQKKFNISLMNEKSANYLGSFIMRLIAQRKQQPNAQYNDLLSQLLKAELPMDDATADPIVSGDPDELTKDRNNNQDGASKKMTRLSDPEIAGQLMLFFIAGVESLTTLFSEPLHLLAQHADIQQQLSVEMQQSFGSEILITYDNLFDCKYLEACMNEVQRMRFSVARQFRMSLAAYDLPVPGLNRNDCIHIRPGQLISISTYSLHHDPELFPQPFEFRPQRFLQGQVSSDSFIPFGIGPRTCIAYRFAKLMMRFVLVNVLREFHVSLGSRSQVPLRYKLMSFVMDYEEMWLRFEPRRLESS